MHDPPRPLPHRPPTGWLPVTRAGTTAQSPNCPWPDSVRDPPPTPQIKSTFAFYLWHGAQSGAFAESVPHAQGTLCEEGSAKEGLHLVTQADHVRPGPSPAPSQSPGTDGFSAHRGHLQGASEEGSPLIPWKPHLWSQPLVTATVTCSLSPTGPGCCRAEAVWLSPRYWEVNRSRAVGTHCQPALP